MHSSSSLALSVFSLIPVFARLSMSVGDKHRPVSLSSIDPAMLHTSQLCEDGCILVMVDFGAASSGYPALQFRSIPCSVLHFTCALTSTVDRIHYCIKVLAHTMPNSRTGDQGGVHWLLPVAISTKYLRGGETLGQSLA
jgi:hypothetical protein